MSNSPIVLITGASRGLGAQAAFAAAQLGAHVVISARNREGLERTADQIRTQTQGKVTVVSGDSSQGDFCQTLAGELLALGSLDALVLNAARIEPIGTVDQVDANEWLEVMNLNLLAPFRLAQALLPLLSQSQGRLITIGTGAAHQPIPSWSAYCCSKAALLMLARVVASEFPQVTSFSFGPGVIDTQMQADIRGNQSTMPPHLHEYFTAMHQNGQLEPPEVPGRALAWCALNAPREWSGQEILYSDPFVAEQVANSFS